MQLVYNAADCLGPDRELERIHRWSLLALLTQRWPDLALALAAPGDSVGSAPFPLHRTRPRSGPAAGLWSDQFDVPRLAGELQADVLWVPAHRSPLRSPAPLVVELGPPPSGWARGLGARLRAAAGMAGARGAAVRITFEEHPPSPEVDAALGPTVSPEFSPEASPLDAGIRERLGLPSEYVLAMGVSRDDVDLLLAAWSWVEGSVGDLYPLVLARSSGQPGEPANSLRTSEAVHVVPLPESGDLPALFRGALVFLHLPGSRSAHPLRWALATGAAIAAVETPRIAAAAGDAAYLTPPGDARALGAACLTLLVSEDVREKLRTRGLARAAAYHDPQVMDSLRAAIEQALNPSRHRSRPA
jgi:hypothetical protein